MTTRPDTAAALAAFLAKGGKVTKTAPATAEAQREATIARRKAERAAEREALAAQSARLAGRVDDADYTRRADEATERAVIDYIDERKEHHARFEIED